MNMKTLAIATLLVAGLAVIPGASADVGTPHADNGCSITGFVDLTNPLNPKVNGTIVGSVMSCIQAPVA